MNMNVMGFDHIDTVNSEFMRYLASLNGEPGERLPPISELSEHLGISSGKLREQLEVARELGLVEVRPKTGIRVREFSFAPAVQVGLGFALALDPSYFSQFSRLRNQLEFGFWHEAVEALGPDDRGYLNQLMERAWSKLEGDPIQIPHVEHRELHMTIFSRLNNPFVLGILEAYWDAYEAVGLNRYEDYSYLTEVWNYHGQMVDAILAGDTDAGHQALIEHTALLRSRPQAAMAELHPNGPEANRRK